MAGEERESNGNTMLSSMVDMGSSSDAVNGLSVGTENGGGSGEGNSVGCWSEGLQTYKRRKKKHTKESNSETTLPEHGKLYVESPTQHQNKMIKEPLDRVLQSSSCDQVCLPRMEAHVNNSLDDCPPPKHWRRVVLEHIYQSLGESDGGIRGCVQDALLFHTESGCIATVKESVNFHEDREKLYSQTGWELNGTQSAAKGHVGVVSNGSLDESNCTVTKLCQCAFFDIIISEKFAQLCNLLLKNFQGMKVDNFFDTSFINSRMEEGTYESKPTLFHSDIQQVWSKIQKVGVEMVALAKSLSEKSRTSCSKLLGDSEHRSSEDGKDQFFTRVSDLHSELELKEACGVYKVCTCRHCGEKADGRDCLVCDSCEEMFHISCIEPAVEKIPVKNWYCAECSANGIESPHENCVVCERLNAPTSPIDDIGNNVKLANGGTLEVEQSSNGLKGAALQILEGDENSCRCKVCWSDVKNVEKFRMCGHPFCPHKYYHVRCLTNKQLKTYSSCWYCPSCLCRACLNDKDDGDIVLCDSCDHAYHIYCLQPPRTSVPRGKWFCRKCQTDIRRIRKARKAYEKIQNKLKKSGEEGKISNENYENEHKERCEEAVDKSGGVDMLLTAARTLKYEENLTGIR
ncbi:PHD finger protein EHD3-like [Cornus florida]|uniref:PHD finger protein EHD3-like n=1 Tax=Cornus florida TaxID=4283 RepID=UPI0028A0F673|nr:PHD finger protein EHD3-like [Cornus florida]